MKEICPIPEDIKETLTERERLINRLGSILSDRQTLLDLINEGEYVKRTPSGGLRVTIEFKGVI